MGQAGNTNSTHGVSRILRRSNEITRLSGSQRCRQDHLVKRFSQQNLRRCSLGVKLSENGLRPNDNIDGMIGYAQQQNIHLSTATVREALRLSALLRQPHECPDGEMLAYIEKVIEMSEMRDFADAIIVFREKVRIIFINRANAERSRSKCRAT